MAAIALRVPRISWHRYKEAPTAYVAQVQADKEGKIICTLRRVSISVALAYAAARPALVMAATAAAKVSVKGKIIGAFWPIIELAQAVSFPLTFLYVTGGMLVIICGNRHKGLEMVKWAALGYLGIQLVPGLMEMMLGLGETLSTGVRVP